MKTFLTYSLGCRVNQAEIEEITQGLIQRGFIPWTESPKEPELVLINTCVVTQKAERETRNAIRKFRRLYPKTFLVVLGCAVDAHQKLKTDLPQADLLIFNEAKKLAIDLILKALRLPILCSMVIRDNQFIRESQERPLLASGRNLIKVQDGCDKYCAFCIVPYLRGKPKSKSPRKIVQEIKKLRNLGIKEIILTGINLSLYGKDLRPKTNLTELLKKILKQTEIPRISLSSLTPEVITKEFIDLYLKDWEKGNGRLSEKQI